MRTLMKASGALTMILSCAAPILAGGFYLITGNPEASAEARALKAALTVKAVGCGDPASATLTATAISVVNGKRESIPLKVTSLSEKGMFAITRQWPEEGTWVLRLVGRESIGTTTTLVAFGPNGLERGKVKQLRGEASDSELAEMLKNVTQVAKK